MFIIKEQNKIISYKKKILYAIKYFNKRIDFIPAINLEFRQIKLNVLNKI